MKAQMGLHTGVWVRPGVWIPNRGYTQVFEYTQAFGFPTAATHGCLDLHPGLHTGVWSPTGAIVQGAIVFVDSKLMSPQDGSQTGEQWRRQFCRNICFWPRVRTAGGDIILAEDLISQRQGHVCVGGRWVSRTALDSRDKLMSCNITYDTLF